MRDLLKLALSDAGYRVLQAEDGVHGLEVLQSETPDVIVTDINMPRMDGFGLIEAVRANQNYRGVPILVLTTKGTRRRRTVLATPAPPVGSSSPSTR